MNYRLSDFLLFSPEVYWQLLFEFFNSQSLGSLVWWLAVTLGIKLAVTKRLTVIFTQIFAFAWLFLGLFYYFYFYSQLNPYAIYFGFVCLLQAIILLLVTWQNRENNHRLPKWSAAVCVLGPIPTLLFAQPWQIGLIGATPLFTSVITLLFCYETKKAIWWYLPALLILALETLTLLAFYT